MGGTIKLRPPDGEGQEGYEKRARFLLKVFEAARKSEDAAGILPEETSDLGIERGIVHIPAEFKDAVRDALVKETGGFNCFAAFAGEDKPEEPAKEEEKSEERAPLEVGKKAEAKYGNSFFAAKIMEIGEDKIKVKWDHDSSEAELNKDEVRGKAVKAEETKEEAKEGAKEEAKEEAKEKAKEEAKDDVKMEVKEDKKEEKCQEPKAFAVDDVVQAKYGNSFFAAKIMEIGDEKIKVKWDHDSSETEVPKDEVKAKEEEKKEEKKEEWKDDKKEEWKKDEWKKDEWK